MRGASPDSCAVSPILASARRTWHPRALRRRSHVQASAKAPAAETNKVVVRSLNFYFGQAHALKDFSLNLYKGQVTAFIGISGCGKSTLLRLLTRMYLL